MIMVRLSLLFIATTSMIMVKDVTSFCAIHKRLSSSPITMKQKNNVEHHDEEEDNNIIPSFHRRSLLLSTIFAASCSGTHCNCYGFPSSANALVELTQEPSSSNNYYLQRPRSKLMDNIFAQQMATTMVEYEEEVEQYKADLFQKLFYSLGDAGRSDNVPVVIVEVGMGTFPNAKFYARALSSAAAPNALDIVGVDPNESMVTYARDAYERELLGRSESSFRTVKGIAEALPFSDGSVDVVVSTLTLCSVVDQQQALSEIRRVLKPNGKLLFWEHVLSDDNSALALQLTLLNHLQKLSSDGCHLNRRTGMNIETVFGKGRVDVNYITLGDKWVIGPTAFGIATA